MTAYIAREAFLGHHADGTDVLIPVGARVEEGDHYHRQKPDAFEIEVEDTKFFGRDYRGLTVISGEVGEQPVTVDLGTGKAVPPYSDQEWTDWLRAEQAYLQAEAVASAQETPPEETPDQPRPKSSIGRRLPPAKK